MVNLLISPFMYHDLGLRAVASILANKQIIIVRNKAIASVAILLFELIPKLADSGTVSINTRGVTIIVTPSSSHICMRVETRGLEPLTSRM